MQLEARIQAFTDLGRFLSQFSSETPEKLTNVPHNERYFEQFPDVLRRAKEQNAWFTLPFLRSTLKHWSEALTEENLKNWLTPYNITTPSQPKTVGIVMAGNIPLVGFHDLLCVLLSGHHVQAKMSSNDTVLLPFLISYLQACVPEWEHTINITENHLSDFDAVIATGSNNTARYFEAYFKEYPHIIRKNRNGVAVLTGNETHEELVSLGDDIFRYFGLGCRNVSKLYVPEDYSFDNFFKAMYTQRDVIHHHKYINNYDYNKAVYLMSEIALLDNEFMVLKEDTAMASPISVIFYEYYEHMESLQAKLAKEAENIQVIVGNELPFDSISLGKAQEPELWDYADEVDTISFLKQLS